MPLVPAVAAAFSRGGVSSGLVLAALLSAWGCAPRLNWRDVRAPGTTLEAQMPCRPSSHARKALLAGQLREVNLLACSAGDATWALAWIEQIDPTELAALTAELRRLALSNIGAVSAAAQPFALPGSTPNPAAGRSRAAGRRPDGSSVTQDVAIFSQGTTVFQVTTLAERPEAEAVEHFFGALRFAR